MPSYTDKRIIDALTACRGMTYVAAQKLGCSPDTIRKRVRDKPIVAQALEDARGATTDHAELRLFMAIDAGEAWAVQFYLRTMARNRGYGDRTEITGADGAPIVVESYVDRIRRLQQERQAFDGPQILELPERANGAERTNGAG